MSRPKVFISSTVHDLRDLRSAIRWWLESMGFEVRISERTDFPADNSTDAISACFDVIDQCDHFVLIIGFRAGFMLDPTQNLSMTRAEYRRAYEKVTDGRMRLACFVRSEVQSMRASLPPAPDQAPGAFENLALTRDFLDEVQRVGKYKPLPGKANNPNWVFTFDRFSDVVDGLNVSFRIGKPLRRKALELAIRDEILSSLRVLVPSPDMATTSAVPVMPPALLAAYKSSQKCAEVRVPRVAIAHLSMFLSATKGALQGFSVLPAIDEAIRSGEFLNYSIVTQSFEQSEIHRKLLEVKRVSECLERLGLGIRIEQCSDYLLKFHQTMSDHVVLPRGELMSHVLLHDTLMEHRYRLADLYHALEGLVVFPNGLPQSRSLEPELYRDNPDAYIKQHNQVIENWLASLIRK